LLKHEQLKRRTHYRGFKKYGCPYTIGLEEQQKQQQAMQYLVGTAMNLSIAHATY